MAKRPDTRHAARAGRPPPAGDEASPERPLAFAVQKHAARSLHDDLRLELDGVMKSWAVTRGPPLGPGVRRLAVPVADHALDYAGWEGVIPPGRYGAGTVWDRGPWRPEGDPRAGLAAGRLTFDLDGERLRGRWRLVRAGSRTGRPAWLLIKSRDGSARRAGDPDILEEYRTSMLTGRTNEDLVAAGP